MHGNFSHEARRTFYATERAWEEIRDRNLFDGALAWSWTRFELAADGNAERVEALIVSEGFFDVLGCLRSLGRLFRDVDGMTSIEFRT